MGQGEPCQPQQKNKPISHLWLEVCDFMVASASRVGSRVVGGAASSTNSGIDAKCDSVCVLFGL